MELQSSSLKKLKLIGSTLDINVQIKERDDVDTIYANDSKPSEARDVAEVRNAFQIMSESSKGSSLTTKLLKSKTKRKRIDKVTSNASNVQDIRRWLSRD